MYKIIFPEHYQNNEFSQFETSYKGYLYGVKLKVEKSTYELVLYDYRRLQQDSEAENKDNFYFHEPNLIILKEITKEAIEKAIKSMYEKNEMQYLLPD